MRTLISSLAVLIAIFSPSFGSTGSAGDGSTASHMASNATPRLTAELTKDPQQAWQLFQRAEQLLETGQFEEAVKLCTRAFELNEELFPALVLRAQARIFLGLYDAAVADAEKADLVAEKLRSKGGTAIPPVQSNKMTALKMIAADRRRLGERFGAEATAELKKGNVSGAQRLVEIAIRHTPEDARHYNTRAILHARRGNWRQAAEELTTAIQRDPTNPTWHFSRGLARKNLGQTSEAIADLERCLAMRPRPEIATAARAELDKLRQR